MKSGVRFLALASGPIQKKRRVLLLGVVSKFDQIEGVLSSDVAVDGTDATDKIISMVSRSRFNDQIRIIAINGIALAGLNVIDLKRLEKRLKVNVIILTRTRPRPSKLILALNNFSKINKKRVDDRVELVRDAAKVDRIRASGVYLQSTLGKAELKKFAANAFEILRMAHLFASGVSSGESRGRI